MAYSDSRSIANNPKTGLLESIGYCISEATDQPGLWVWMAPSDGCEISFDSADLALADAWRDAAQQTCAILEISEQTWTGLDFSQQRKKILEALSEGSDDEELPVFKGLSPSIQLQWVAQIRVKHPLVDSSEAFRLAEADYVEREGVLPNVQKDIDDVVADVLECAGKDGFTPDAETVRAAVSHSADQLSIALNGSAIELACAQVLDAGDKDVPRPRM